MLLRYLNNKMLDGKKGAGGEEGIWKFSTEGKNRSVSVFCSSFVFLLLRKVFQKVEKKLLTEKVKNLRPLKLMEYEISRVLCIWHEKITITFMLNPPLLNNYVHSLLKTLILKNISYFDFFCQFCGFVSQVSINNC